METEKVYAVMFRMAKHAYTGAIRVYDDGEASAHWHLAHEDRPVLVEVEGNEPTAAQLVTLQAIWVALTTHFNFSVASFCPVLMEHQAFIKGVGMVVYEFVRPAGDGQEGARAERS